jgi:hypothetical protein
VRALPGLSLPLKVRRVGKGALFAPCPRAPGDNSDVGMLRFATLQDLLRTSLTLQSNAPNQGLAAEDGLLELVRHVIELPMGTIAEDAS